MAENFVLVHGAWHGGWAWQPVASRLRAAGHQVSAPTCPGLGIDDDPGGVTLADCVDHVVNHVEASGARDITLVGHSWGGYVIAGAAPRLASRLKNLVFWSAFVPEAGRSLYDEVPPNYQDLFTQVAGASADNTVALPVEVFQGAFMGDADPATAVVVHSVLRPQPFRTFTDPPVGDEPTATSASRCTTCYRPGTSRCRPASTAGIASPSGSRPPRCRCPAATSRCSPAPPNWPRRLSRSPLTKDAATPGRLQERHQRYFGADPDHGAAGTCRGRRRRSAFRVPSRLLPAAVQMRWARDGRRMARMDVGVQPGSRRRHGRA